MANLLKFFRVESLPTTGVVGGLYFVHGGEIAAGNGKLYVCTAENTFELYSGVNASELSTKLGDYVLKTQKIAGVDLQDDITAKELMVALKSLLDNSAEEGKFIKGFTVNSETGELEAEYGAVEATDTTYSFESGADATSGAYFTVTEEGQDPQTVYVNADVAGTARSLIEALDLDDKAVEGEYVSAVSQVDGQISVTRAQLPAGVKSIDEVNGALTLRKGQTEVGSVNLEMDGKEITATLVGTFEDGAQVNILEGVKVDGTALEIGKTDKAVNWKLVYNSDAKKLQVLDLNNSNVVVNEVDATAFIKDGMVSNAKIVWCTVDAEGKHEVVTEGTEGAIRCLQITFNTDAGKEDIHIPLNELTDVYTGRDGEIEVTEQNVIGLVDKDVEEPKGEDIKPVLGGTFDVVTDVTYDEKGRLATVETSTVTLPTIADGDKTGSDDYVSVQVKTAAGAVSEVIVNTDALSEKISGIEADITEVAQVTAAALVDLDARLGDVEDGTIKSVTGETAELNNSDYVNVKADTVDGAVTLASTVKAVEATDAAKYPSTGLATDGYVNEKVATVAATADTAVQNIESKDATIQVTRAEASNDVNLELVWQMF